MQSDIFDLIKYTNPTFFEGYSKEQIVSIQNSFYSLELNKIVNREELYLYYEIRSIKGSKLKALKVMKQLLELGVSSLQRLQEMDEKDLIMCELPEYIEQTNKLDPKFQSFLYETMMVEKLSDRIDTSIQLLKKKKILTFDQFFSEDEQLVQKQLLFPKYEFRFQKLKFIGNKQNFKPQMQILQEKSQEINAPQNEIKLPTPNSTLSAPLNCKIIRKLFGLSLLQYPIFQKDQISDLSQFQTIVFVGQSGAGKTTLINFFLNCYLEVNFSDQYRYVLADENQTISNNIYYIKPQNGKKGLRIVDTIGFGRTYDKNTSQKILELLYNEIDSITLVCYVVSSSTPRLSVQELTILDFIMKTFGFEFSQNCIFTLTFSDSGEPQAIDSLIFQGDGYQKPSPVFELIKQIPEPWFLKFNSSALFADNQNNQISVAINQNFWEMGVQSFKLLYQNKLSKNINIPSPKMEIQPTVIQNIHIIRNSFEKLKKILFQYFSQLNQLKQDYPTISYTKSEYKIKDFQLKKTKNKSETYSINCGICQITCFSTCLKSQTISSFLIPDSRNQLICICGCGATIHSTENLSYEIDEKEISKKFYTSQNRQPYQQIQEIIIFSYYELLKQSFKLQKVLMELCKIFLQNQQQTVTQCQNYEQFLDFLIEEERKKNDVQRCKILEQRKQDWRWMNQNQYCKNSEEIFNSLKVRISQT